MNFEIAIRSTEILTGFAFALQSMEHLQAQGYERQLFSIRLIMAICLLIGFQSNWVTGLLFLIGLVQLHRFQGPYNGGSDRMGLLILSSLFCEQLAPTRYWQEIAFAYLSVQLMLSYFMSGWVKIKNPQWRTGRALRDVFQFSVYPVSESMREWTKSPILLFYMSWCVILFELIFPIAIFSESGLVIALTIAFVFHFTNACLFGLNRFFWIWIAAYPSILWFQERVLAQSW